MTTFTPDFRLSGAHPLRTALAWAVVVPLAVIAWLIAFIDRVLGFPLLFPRDLVALGRRREWLVKQLQSRNALPAGAATQAVDLRPVRSQVAFRSVSGFVEVTYDEAGQRKKLECFAKFAPQAGSIWNRAIFNVQGNALKETLFNTALMTEPTVPAPRPYFARCEPLSGNLCLITERMADAIEYHENHESLTDAHVDVAVEGLARLHARWWNQTAQIAKHVTAIGPGVVGWFDSLIARSWSRAARTLMVRSWTLMNAPQAVLHGDARVGNMMFPSANGHGRFVLIDWQAVRTGKGAFDLAYFLLTSLNEGRVAQREGECIDAYHQKLVALGVTDYPFEALRKDYRHAVLCVLVLLCLPLLSGEASAEAQTAQLFVDGMGLWRTRLECRLARFDFDWVAREYGVTANEGRAAVAEMLATITRRLERIRARART